MSNMDWITVEEAARIMCNTIDAARAFVRRHKIATEHYAGQRRVLVYRPALVAALKRQSVR